MNQLQLKRKLEGIIAMSSTRAKLAIKELAESIQPETEYVSLLSYPLEERNKIKKSIVKEYKHGATAPALSKKYKLVISNIRSIILRHWWEVKGVGKSLRKRDDHTIIFIRSNNIPIRKLAEMFGVSRSWISAVRNYLIYKDVQAVNTNQVCPESFNH